MTIFLKEFLDRAKYVDIAKIVKSYCNSPINNVPVHQKEYLKDKIIAGNTLAVVKWLLTWRNLDVQDSQGRPFVMYIVANGFTYMLDIFIEAGANLIVKDKPDYDLFSVAANYNRDSMLEPLVKAGLNPNARDAKGRTALMTAMIMKQPDISLPLLKAGSVPSLTDYEGNTALMWAGSNTMMRNALEKAINLLSQYRDHRTSFIIVCRDYLFPSLSAIR